MSKYDAQVEVAKLNGDPEPPGPPKKRGRKPLGDKKMVQTAVWLRAEQIQWMKNQPVTMSETMRELIDQKMNCQ